MLLVYETLILTLSAKINFIPHNLKCICIYICIYNIHILYINSLLCTANSTVMVQ